ncbi:MAG: carotenoid oxygenase family protein [Leptolyngbyaceae bacterium]|nr:carotenoid oxygenase family protein [Leptolyngbyaceae bacterium]
MVSLVSSLSSSQAQSWAKAVTHTATEFPLTPLPVLSGAIPAGLRGSLYRNGPARLERGGQRVGHWFDGDGAILGVHFTDAGASGVYRYVQTAGYQAEEQAGKFLYGGYGMLPSGPFWERFIKDAKNAANTSVLALPDKLLALWEGGKPHALNLETLETYGLDDLDSLGQGLTYAAHPKRDPQTGEIFNFGISYGKEARLNVYRSDRTGKIQKQAQHSLKGLPMVHDFVLAGNYLVFFVSPVNMQPFSLLLRLKSFSDTLSWQPEQGTQIVVIDRHTLEVVSRGEAEPWYQWHFGNGYGATDGSVVVDLVRYEDFQTNQYLQEVASGHTQTAAKGTLWQLRLNPQSGQVTEMQEVCDRTCEFPSVNPREVGQASRYTYVALRRLGVDISQEMFGAIGCFDYQSGTLLEADLGQNCYPMEPLYAPDATNPNQGWLLTVVFDGNQNRSEVWILDADHLDHGPVCRLALPSIIPLGFHGTWKPAV